ncbi:hypothetical protein XENTR_v10025014 [Xenopus tropicalis]|nr:hypothetical protein XENTR_v10025014 [Xenopus tropicalis]
MLLANQPPPPLCPLAPLLPAQQPRGLFKPRLLPVPLAGAPCLWFATFFPPFWGGGGGYKYINIYKYFFFFNFSCNE